MSGNNPHSEDRLDTTSAIEDGSNRGMYIQHSFNGAQFRGRAYGQLGNVATGYVDANEKPIIAWRETNDYAYIENSEGSQQSATGTIGTSAIDRLTVIHDDEYASGQIVFAYGWSRALTSEERQIIYNDPYQFLLPA